MPTETGAAASGAKPKGPSGPVIIEQSFKVDGQKLTVLVTFPATVAQEIGLDNVLICANRALVGIETKHHEVAKLRPG